MAFANANTYTPPLFSCAPATFQLLSILQRDRKDYNPPSPTNPPPFKRFSLVFLKISVSHAAPRQKLPHFFATRRCNFVKSWQEGENGTEKWGRGCRRRLSLIYEARGGRQIHRFGIYLNYFQHFSVHLLGESPTDGLSRGRLGRTLSLHQAFRLRFRPPPPPSERKSEGVERKEGGKRRNPGERWRGEKAKFKRLPFPCKLNMGRSTTMYPFLEL